MIRSGNIEIPVKALDDDVPLHLYKVLVAVPAPDQPLDVLNGGLALILLVGLTGEQHASEGYKVQVLPDLFLAKALHFVEPLRVSLLLVEPSFKIHAGDVRRLKLQAQTNSRF